MTLKELLPLIDLECEIVLDCDLWELSKGYESRGAIPADYNDCKVINVTTDMPLRLWIDLAHGLQKVKE